MTEYTERKYLFSNSLLPSKVLVPVRWVIHEEGIHNDLLETGASSRPIIKILLRLASPTPCGVVHPMRDTHVSFEQVLAHEAPLLKRRTDLTRIWFLAFMTRLVPLALVLPQELHPAASKRTLTPS